MAKTCRKSDAYLMHMFSCSSPVIAGWFFQTRRQLTKEGSCGLQQQQLSVGLLSNGFCLDGTCQWTVKGKLSWKFHFLE